MATAASFLLWPAVAARRHEHRPDAYFATQSAWYARDAGWPTWLTGLLGGGEPGPDPGGRRRLRCPGARAAAQAGAAVGLRAPHLGVGLPALHPWLHEADHEHLPLALLAVVPWWPFPEIGRQVTARRDRLALVALVALLGIGAQLVWLRWYWVIGPDTLSFP